MAIIFSRANEKAIITRCGFSEQNRSLGYRNLFLRPDGKVINDVDGELSIDLLREIHSRDMEGFARKIECYFPPAKRI